LWTCRKECNKYDLTAAQYFWLVIIMIGWGGLLWVVHHHLFAAPVSFSFMGGHYITKFECWKIFLQGHILSTTGDALTWSFSGHSAFVQNAKK
jgi:hypothetical protein